MKENHTDDEGKTRSTPFIFPLVFDSAEILRRIPTLRENVVRVYLLAPKRSPKVKKIHKSLKAIIKKAKEKKSSEKEKLPTEKKRQKEINKKAVVPKSSPSPQGENNELSQEILSKKIRILEERERTGISAHEIGKNIDPLLRKKNSISAFGRLLKAGEISPRLSGEFLDAVLNEYRKYPDKRNPALIWGESGPSLFVEI